MKFNRSATLFVCTTVAGIVCHCSAFREVDSDSPPQSRSLLFLPLFPVNRDKTFSIFSKPPEPSKDDTAKKQHEALGGGGIISHVGNVLHGGSIGLEIRPLSPFQGILDHAKKFLPGSGSQGTVGRPNHERPDHDNYERPNYERPHHERPNYERPHQERPNYERPRQERPNYERPHQERPNYERPHQERPNYERPHQERPSYYERPHHERPQPAVELPNEDDWEMKDPKKPEITKKPDEGPHWEDIGESPENDDTDESGIGILQPRGRRPKRFIESKIYHVPLLYRSNGRPYEVRIKNRNSLNSKRFSKGV